MTTQEVEMDADDEWLTLPQAATLMRMTRPSIAQMRYRGIGPTFYRITAKRILYKRSEVVAWMESRACTRTDDVLAPR